MARVAQPRAGHQLESKGRVLPFSFFPVTRTKRRYGLYDTVFAVNPWSVMHGSVNTDVATSHRTELRRWHSCSRLRISIEPQPPASPPTLCCSTTRS